MSGDEDFLNEIRQDFIAEALEMVEKAESCFIQFERDPDDLANIEEILRLFHSLKGSSFAVSYENLAKFSHRSEDFIIDVKNKKIPITSEVADALLLCSDLIQKGLLSLKNGEEDQSIYRVGFDFLESIYNGESRTAEVKDKASVAVEESSQIEKTKEETDSPVDLRENQPLKDDPAKEDSIVEAPEEVVVASPINSKAGEGKSKTATEDNSIKVNMKKIDSLLDFLGEQIIWQKKLSYLFRGDIQKNYDEIISVIHNLEKITLELQQNSMSLRMVNLQSTFRRLERVVRETAKTLDKPIDLQISGADNELDKTIVDALINPLTHMLRNAIDHGIEDKEGRVKNNKNPVGTIQLNAYRRGGFFYIEICDDGKGLDRKAIEKKAIAKGLIAQGHTLSENQIHNLIFNSGFSTKETATDISGRGVGMDVVKQMILGLKGTCEILSQEGVGSTFTVKLPLALAMFQGMIFKVGGHQFIIPNSDFRETGEVNLSAIYKTEKNKMVTKYKNRVISVISLRDQFRIRDSENLMGDRCLGAVVNYENEDFMLLFDDVVAQERIVLKKLLPNLEQISGIVGGTILGDGKVALVLGARELVESHKIGA